MKRTNQTTQANFKLFTDQIQKLSDALKSQSVSLELLEERKNKEVKILETNFNISLNIEKANRKDFEEQFQGNFDNKINRIRNEISSEKRDADNKFGNLLTNVSNELNEVQGELFAERKSREEKFDTMIKKLGADVLRINDLLTEEKKVSS